MRLAARGIRTSANLSEMSNIELMSAELSGLFPLLTQVDVQAIPMGFKLNVDQSSGSPIGFKPGERYVVAGLGPTAWEKIVIAE
jgi:hypothetical protein